MSLHARLQRLETRRAELARDLAKQREKALVEQLNDITDDELDRLEAICKRIAEATDGPIWLPDNMTLSEIIAFAEAEPERFYAAMAEAANA